MKITSLINNVSRVARVVELSEGDVYKRIKEKTEGYGGEARIYYGKVLNILATDEASAVEVIEFSGGYSPEEPTHRVFSQDEDIMIVPCGVEEYSVEADLVLQRMTKALVYDENAIEIKRKKIAQLENTFSRKGITGPAEGLYVEA